MEDAHASDSHVAASTAPSPKTLKLLGVSAVCFAMFAAVVSAQTDAQRVATSRHHVTLSYVSQLPK